MPPRVAYWLSSFEPEMEAVASEVRALRRHFPGSVAWGMSHRHWALCSWRRGFCLHPRLHLLFRAATRLLEPTFQLNHVFGSLGDWFYLQGGRRRPTVLTVAAHAPPLPLSLLDRDVDHFVAECLSGAAALRRLGIAENRTQTIFPPVDLERFSPTPPPAGPFTVLFASAPDRADWLAGRGVIDLLETAALRPQVRFRLIWRPWGDSLPVLQRQLVERRLSNVEVVLGRFADMAAHYRGAHVTAAPFVRPECCKPASNSLIEGLACGRPVLATPIVGLAPLIDEARAGVICADGPGALAEGLDRLQADFERYSASARALAERCFGLGRFLEDYRQLYERMTGRPRRTVAAWRGEPATVGDREAG